MNTVLSVYNYIDYFSIFSFIYAMYINNNDNGIFYVFLFLIFIQIFMWCSFIFNNRSYNSEYNNNNNNNIFIDWNYFLYHKNYLHFKWYFLFFLIKIPIFFTILLNNNIDENNKILYYTIIHNLINLIYYYCEYIFHRNKGDLFFKSLIINILVSIVNIIPLYFYAKYVNFSNNNNLKYIQFLFVITNVILCCIMFCIYICLDGIYNLYIIDCINYFNLNNSYVNIKDKYYNFVNYFKNKYYNFSNYIKNIFCKYTLINNTEINNDNNENNENNNDILININYNDYIKEINENYNFKEITGKRKCLMCRKIQKCSKIEKKDNSNYNYIMTCSICDTYNANIIFNECKHCNICSNCIIYYELE